MKKEWQTSKTEQSNPGPGHENPKGIHSFYDAELTSDDHRALLQTGENVQLYIH